MSYAIDLTANGELCEEINAGLNGVLEDEVAAVYEENSSALDECFMEAAGRVLQAMDRAMEAALDEERAWLRDRIMSFAEEA